MRKELGTLATLCLLLTIPGIALAAPSGKLDPRVPSKQLAQAVATENPIKASADSVGLGERLYFDIGCHNCHGGGVYVDPRVKEMNPAPTRLSRASWQSARSDGELRYTILYGVKGTAMIGNKVMFDRKEDVWHLVNYIRSLKK